MKIIHIEDDPVKQARIARVLKGIGYGNVAWVKNYEAAVEAIKNNRQEIQLLVSDMNFPVQGEEVSDAGERIIRFLSENGLEIPVIIISSMRYIIPEAFRVIFYAEQNDWETELKVAVKEGMKIRRMD